MDYIFFWPFQSLASGNLSSPEVGLQIGMVYSQLYWTDFEQLPSSDGYTSHNFEEHGEAIWEFDSLPIAGCEFCSSKIILLTLWLQVDCFSPVGKL